MWNQTNTQTVEMRHWSTARLSLCRSSAATIQAEPQIFPMETCRQLQSDRRAAALLKVKTAQGRLAHQALKRKYTKCYYCLFNNRKGTLLEFIIILKILTCIFAGVSYFFFLKKKESLYGGSSSLVTPAMWWSLKSHNLQVRTNHVICTFVKITWFRGLE